MISQFIKRFWRNKNSILFVRPDFHCSFFYRDEFRKLGWKADIFVPWGYHQKLLYSDNDILRSPKISRRDFLFFRYLNYILLILWWHGIFWRYRYHIYYGRPPILNNIEKKLGLTKLFGDDFLLELCLSSLFGVRLIYLPTGCHDNDLKKKWAKFDGGNVCKNCGFFDRCDDASNALNFRRIRRYFNAVIGNDSEAKKSSEIEEIVIKYKAIDLNLWSPELQVPSKYLLPKSYNLRILHSAYLKGSGRNWQGRNIKGSPYVLAAIERLKSEGYQVEYFFIQDKPANQMRFYQAQADIIVEQLIYGWWGSTGVETMALGKPVVCYLRPSWKEFFIKMFPEYNDLPIVEATAENIYEVLKRLVTDETYRLQKGKDSRRFAEQHFDPEKNTQSLIKLLESL